MKRVIATWPERGKGARTRWTGTKFVKGSFIALHRCHFSRDQFIVFCRPKLARSPSYDIVPNRSFSGPAHSSSDLLRVFCMIDMVAFYLESANVPAIAWFIVNNPVFFSSSFKLRRIFCFCFLFPRCISGLVSHSTPFNPIKGLLQAHLMSHDHPQLSLFLM